MNVKKNDNRSDDNISYKVYGYVRNQYQRPFAGAHIPGIILDPVPNPDAALDLTADGIYGSLLHKSTNYSSNNPVPLVWKIINPVGNARITGDQIKDLIIIIHYNVS